MTSPYSADMEKARSTRYVGARRCGLENIRFCYSYKILSKAPAIPVFALSVLIISMGIISRPSRSLNGINNERLWSWLSSRKKNSICLHTKGFGIRSSSSRVLEKGYTVESHELTLL